MMSQLVGLIFICFLASCFDTATNAKEDSLQQSNLDELLNRQQEILMYYENGENVTDTIENELDSIQELIKDYDGIIDTNYNEDEIPLLVESPINDIEDSLVSEDIQVSRQANYTLYPRAYTGLETATLSWRPITRRMYYEVYRLTWINAGAFSHWNTKKIYKGYYTNFLDKDNPARSVSKLKQNTTYKYRVVCKYKIYSNGRYYDRTTTSSISAKTKITGYKLPKVQNLTTKFIIDDPYKIYLNWGLILGADGYEIEKTYKNTNGNDMRLIYNSNKVSVYDIDLKKQLSGFYPDKRELYDSYVEKNRVYNYRVRAYNTYNGVKYYGDYSDMKWEVPGFYHSVVKTKDGNLTYQFVKGKTKIEFTSKIFDYKENDRTSEVIDDIVYYDYVNDNGTIGPKEITNPFYPQKTGIYDIRVGVHNKLVDVGAVTIILHDTLKVIERNPAPGSTKISSKPTIKVKFSQIVTDASLTSSNFSVTGPNNSVVQCTVRKNSSNKYIVEIIPKSNLAYGTTYKVNLKRGIQSNVSDSYLENDISWNFKTKEQLATPILANPIVKNFEKTVSLSWNRVTNATGYKIFKNNSLWNVINNGSTITANDTFSSNSSDYYYYVIATNESNYVDSKKSTTKTAAAPYSEPASIVYTGSTSPIKINTSEIAYISWEIYDQFGNSSFNLNDYNVKYNIKKSFNNTTTEESTLNSVTFSSQTPGTYLFWIECEVSGTKINNSTHKRTFSTSSNKVTVNVVYPEVDTVILTLDKTHTLPNGTDKVVISAITKDIYGDIYKGTDNTYITISRPTDNGQISQQFDASSPIEFSTIIPAIYTVSASCGDIKSKTSTITSSWGEDQIQNVQITNGINGVISGTNSCQVSLSWNSNLPSYYSEAKIYLIDNRDIIYSQYVATVANVPDNNVTVTVPKGQFEIMKSVLFRVVPQASLDGSTLSGEMNGNDTYTGGYKVSANYVTLNFEDPNNEVEVATSHYDYNNSDVGTDTTVENITFRFPIGNPTTDYSSATHSTYQASDWWTSQKVGDYYGDRFNGYHCGEDWNYGSGSDDLGKPVYAVANGTVVKLKSIYNSVSSGGYMMVIEHDLVDYKVYSVYLHITSENNTNGDLGSIADFTNFQIGAPVSKGDIIGRISKCEWFPSHLHFEMRHGNCREITQDTDLWQHDNGKGYYDDTFIGEPVYEGEGASNGINAMMLDGILNPSAFISAHMEQ